MTIVLVLVSVVLAYLRVTGAHGQVYQATAHLFVGGLIGGAVASKYHRFTLVTLTVVLSVVEVTVFVISRR